MQLSDEHILTFQNLYRKHFGRNISKEEALKQGLQLIRLVEIVSCATEKDSMKFNDNK